MEQSETIEVDVHCVENAWIALPDGTRLAAKMWMPHDAHAQPVPAILEFLPYRKRDGTAARDALTHPFFAAHGYVCIRVDTRGNGESDGLMTDEYTPQELADACDVITWMRAQPWCNGQVGMMGISWGGFNALQTAALRPEGLNAIITLCSTDDRFADDIHYSGGCLLNENHGWGATMLSYSSRPPDPALVGERWRKMWLNRLEQQPLLIDEWLTHQTRDAYWQHGSVCEDFSRITAATLAIGGWGDAYSNAIPRLLEGLKAPRKAIIGPWVHKYPHFAVPEPRIGFLQEALRWWDRWLKGRETGVEDDPDLRVYMMDGVRPATWFTERPGEWHAIQTYPPQTQPQQAFTLAPSRLVANGQSPAMPPGSEKTRIAVKSPQHCGINGGEYCAIWLGPDWPGDQREDDARSEIFDTAPLTHALPLLGAAELTITVSSDQPFALLAARLCHVHPDGASTRITHDVKNLRHRDDPARPGPLVPGEELTVTLKFDDVAYRIPAGHRLRLSLSTTYWPLVWPGPHNATLALDPGTAHLALPLAPETDTPDAVTFPPPRSAPPQRLAITREAAHKRRTITDQASGEVTIEIEDDFGLFEDLDTGIVSEEIARETQTIHPDDPLCASMNTHWTQVRSRDDWQTRTETRTTMHADAENFYIRASVEAFEGDKKIHEKTWDRAVPREHV
ncbi:MAG: CocE/NonD family hydrolase [Pseudomonadota bacterium]